MRLLKKINYCLIYIKLRFIFLLKNVTYVLLVKKKMGVKQIFLLTVKARIYKVSSYFLNLELFCRKMIKIENLSKKFNGKNGKVTALDNINVEMHDGDIFGIIGMSGAGKSTLLRCITLLERPDSGSIFIDGNDILTLNHQELRKARRKMGVVFQHYNLLMQETVAKNVAFPMEIAEMDKKQIKERVEELLTLVKIDDKADFYPAQLSGGQRQRVAIARALATNPEALLCDEPTSALDALTTKQVLNLLKEINKSLNTTIIIITHEMSAVKAICNKVAVINEGRFVEMGLTKDVFTNPSHDVTKMLLGMGDM